MSLGSSLYHARKKSGLTQENVAEKLGVSRQTISKWETNETLPDIRQSKGLAMLYHMTLDELIEYDFDEQQAQQMIDSVSDEAQARIDWNKVWSKKYPVLATYHKAGEKEVRMAIDAAMKAYDVPLMRQTLSLLRTAVENGQISVTDYYVEADNVYRNLLAYMDVERQYHGVVADITKNGL